MAVITVDNEGTGESANETDYKCRSTPKSTEPITGASDISGV
jgi:hypothetical protein